MILLTHLATCDLTSLEGLTDENRNVCDLVFTRAIILSLIIFIVLCLVFYLKKPSQMISLRRDLEVMFRLLPTKRSNGPVTSMSNAWRIQDRF